VLPSNAEMLNFIKSLNVISEGVTGSWCHYDLTYINESYPIFMTKSSIISNCSRSTRQA
jgi:hypothetical protein